MSVHATIRRDTGVAIAGAENGVSIDPSSGKIVLGNDVGDLLAPGAIINNREVLFAGGGVRWGAPSPGGIGGQGNFEVGLLWGPPGASLNFLVEGATSAGNSHNWMNFTKDEFILRDEIGGIRDNLTVGFNSSISRITSDLPMTLKDMFHTDNFGSITAILGDFNNIGNGTYFSIFDAAQSSGIQDLLGRILSLDRNNDVYEMGDLDAATNGLNMRLDNLNYRAQLKTVTGSMLDFNQHPSGGVYDIGDVDGVFNQTKISMDDANQFVVVNGGGQMLGLNKSLGIYEIGDIQPDLNATKLSINDTAQFITIESNGTTCLALLPNPGFQQYSIGNVLGPGNGTNLDIQDLVSQVFINSNVAQSLNFDMANGRYQLGQITNGNNTIIDIDDVTQRIEARTVNGFYITGDTTLIHSGTTLANDAAAASATLLNAPVAGNPTKWIRIDDNGTIRRIPAW